MILFVELFVSFVAESGRYIVKNAGSSGREGTSSSIEWHQIGDYSYFCQCFSVTLAGRLHQTF